jgi:hypothetical protein
MICYFTAKHLNIAAHNVKRSGNKFPV